MRCKIIHETSNWRWNHLGVISDLNLVESKQTGAGQSIPPATLRMDPQLMMIRQAPLRLGQDKRKNQWRYEKLRGAQDFMLTPEHVLTYKIYFAGENRAT
jgi:hypothetical protein